MSSNSMEYNNHTLYQNIGDTRWNGFVKKKGHLDSLISESDTPFILGRQYNGGKKEYENGMGFRRFKNEEVMNQYINSNPNTNLFEIIVNDCPKLYVDMDKVSMTTDEIHLLESNLTIYFSKHLDVDDSHNKVVSFIRTETEHNCSENDTNNIYKSIHIIYPFIRCKKETILMLVDLWNSNNPNCKIDNRVYSSNRAWCMPYQTKASNNSKRCFKPLNKTKTLNRNMLYVSSHFDVDMCKIYTTNDNFNNVEYVNLDNKKKKQNKINQTNEDVMIDKRLYDNTVDSESLIKNSSSKKVDITYSVNRHSIIKTLLVLVDNGRLDKQLFTEMLWNRLTQQLILDDVDDIEEWLNISAEYSGGKFTKSDNKTYHTKKIKETKFKGSVQKWIDYINDINCLKIKYNWKNDCCDEKVKWLSGETGLTECEIKSQLTNLLDYDSNKNKTKRPTTINFKNDIYTWDLDRLLLYDNDKKLVRLYNESKYKDKYGVNFDNGWNKSSVKDLENISKNWIDDDTTSILAVKALFGTGKTHYCLEPLVNELRKRHEMDKEENKQIEKDNETLAEHNKKKLKEYNKILIITENNSLNAEYVSKFCGVSHMNKSFLQEDSFIVICSLESIHKLENWAYSLVVLDEYNSILNHFESSTMENIGSGSSEYGNLIVFIDKIVYADKVIALDADLSDDRLEILSSLKETTINKQYITENRWEKYTHNLYHNDKESFLDDLLTDLENKKNVCFPTSSKKFGEVVYNMTLKKIKDINMCMMNSDGVLLMIGGEKVITKPQKEIMTNLTKWLKENEIQLFIHSPTIKTGVSIEGTLFHSVYANISNKSCCVREFIQMLYRCRCTKDETINILCEYDNAEYLSTTDTETIKTMIENNIDFKIRYMTKFGKIGLKQFTPSIDYYKKQSTDIGIKTNPYYLRIKSMNIKETEMTRIGMIHELIGKIAYNHNIKITHKYPTRKHEKLQIKEYKECASELKIREIKEFIDCKIISIDMKNKLRCKMKKNEDGNIITDVEKRQLSKYYNMEVFGVGRYYIDKDDNDKKIFNCLYSNNKLTEFSDIDNYNEALNRLPSIEIRLFNNNMTNMTNMTKITEVDYVNGEYIRNCDVGVDVKWIHKHDGLMLKNNKDNITRERDSGSYSESVLVLEKDIDSFNGNETLFKYAYSNDKYYIKTSQYDYRKVINSNLKHNNEHTSLSTKDLVVKSLLNKTNIQIYNNFNRFISIVKNENEYDIDDVVNGVVNSKISKTYKFHFNENGLSQIDISNNKLYILKWFWVLLDLSFTNKIEITNGEFVKLMKNHTKNIQEYSIRILEVFETEKYLTNFNPQDNSHIKKIKLLIKKILKLIGYGYDYSKFKKYDEFGKRIYNYNISRGTTIMYFGKDVEFGFSGSVGLTSNTNDNDKLPKVVYNVGVGETKKKGRGVYYEKHKMYKLNDNRYINYEPTKVKPTIKYVLLLTKDDGDFIKETKVDDILPDEIKSKIQKLNKLVLDGLDLGKFYGFSVKNQLEERYIYNDKRHSIYSNKYLSRNVGCQIELQN